MLFAYLDTSAAPLNLTSDKVLYNEDTGSISSKAGYLDLAYLRI